MSQAEALGRWNLHVWLSTCPYGEMYSRFTGDEKTAAQFEKLRQKMLAGLQRAPSPPGVGAPREVYENWQQLPLI